MTRAEAIAALMYRVRDGVQKAIRDSREMQQCSAEAKELDLHVSIQMAVHCLNVGEPVGQLENLDRSTHSQNVPSPFPEEAPDWMKGMCVSLGEPNKYNAPGTTCEPLVTPQEAHQYWPAEEAAAVLAIERPSTTGACKHGHASAHGPCKFCDPRMANTLHWHVLMESLPDRVPFAIGTHETFEQAEADMHAINSKPSCYPQIATMPLRPCRGNCPKVEP